MIFTRLPMNQNNLNAVLHKLYVDDNAVTIMSIRKKCDQSTNEAERPGLLMIFRCIVGNCRQWHLQESVRDDRGPVNQ